MSLPTKPPHGLSLTSGQPVDFSRMRKDVYAEVFERIGGIDRLTEVADKDPKWFYEKLDAKLVQPEKITVSREKTVAELLEELDRQMIDVSPVSKNDDSSKE